MTAGDFFTAAFSDSDMTLTIDEDTERASIEALVADDMDRPEIKLIKKPAPKRRPATKNPLKVLSERTDLVASPAGNIDLETPTTASVSTKDTKEGFAKEALQGLQTKLDLKDINLQKMDPDANQKPFGSIANPFKPLMLIQIKGRRHVQSRLVEPVSQSLNLGDCYLLVTKEVVYVWLGEYANVIESNKANELGKWITEKKDMGYAGNSTEPTIVRSEDTFSRTSERFWKALGHARPQAISDAAVDEEDLVFEQLIADTNRCFQVAKDSRGFYLDPVEAGWGKIPAHLMLKSDATFVFDFGTEVYVWCGKKVDASTRKVVVSLAQEWYSQKFDYSPCALSPLYATSGSLLNQLAWKRKGDQRPEWCLLGKVNQNGESVLFKEKFLDWPEDRGLIRNRPSSVLLESDIKPDFEFQPCNVESMLHSQSETANLELENCKLGRGGRWKVTNDGLVREFEVLTLKARVWHVIDFQKFELPKASFGQFHEKDNYIVLWQYKVVTHGNRSSVTGRERSAYFYWQGSKCGLKEKGTGALMTIDMDEERCPQIQVAEGHESPVFTRIFEGSAFVYFDSRKLSKTLTECHQNRLFWLRGQNLEESLLIEVAAKATSLRSRGCFLLFSCHHRKGYVWMGVNAPQWYRDIALARSKLYTTGTPAELSCNSEPIDDWTTVIQRTETREFWKLLEGKLPLQTESALTDPLLSQGAVRAFKFSSATNSGELGFIELKDIQLSHEYVNPFPFHQNDIYSLPQPTNAFVLFDCHSCLFLWQGWVPSNDDWSASTGSAQARFDAEKLAVLKTAYNYGNARGISDSKQFIISVNQEPLLFQHFFPSWTPSSSSTLHHENLTILQVLNRLSNLTYSLCELQQRPFPEGVDPARLERYLSHDDFVAAFEMTRQAFDALPDWKKVELKKSLSLY